MLDGKYTRIPSMRSIYSGLIATALALLCLSVRAAETDLTAQLSKFTAVKMPYNSVALTPREKRLVAKLVEATRYLDEVFWQQSDPKGLQLYRSLASSKKPADQQLRRLLTINGGRYDLIHENAPFGGAGPRPPGGSMYPADLTRDEFEAYVAKHAEQKAAAYDPYTVVRRQGGALLAIPYHIAYRKWLTPMTKALREAAALSDDAAFAKFLRMRADSLLTDDYFQSDLAWLDLVNPKFDVIFAPYETYLDSFLGVKTSYGASVLIRNDAESRKLEVFQKFIPDIQDALPLSAEDRPSKKGHSSPMEVMDAPFRGGDLRHGYQAVADNLPNDPRVHEQKGSKKIFFKNFMDARVNYVILPIAKRLMKEDQVHLATANGYLTTTLMHEIAHGIGPAFSRTATGKKDIREAIGAEFGGLEEAKADIVGLYGLQWLADHGDFPKQTMAECYASEVAGIFRTVRFGVAEAHGRAEIMEFNFFTERGVVTFDAPSGRYAVDVAGMPAAVAALAKELLEQEATGDRARVEAWFAKYGSVPAQLAQALEKVNDVPVDIDPVSDFHDL
jgi:Peptidase family M49